MGPLILSEIGVDVAVGDGVIDGVTEADAEGVADAEAEAEVVAFAVVDTACDVLLAGWLLLVDDVQPATLTLSTAINTTPRSP